MLRSKKVTIILSFLIAVVVWAYVIAIENPPATRKFEKVPVQLLSLELLAQSDLAILTGMDATVDVVVSGKRADIAKLNQEDLIATANVFGLTRIGPHLVPVVVSPPSSAVSVEEIRAANILIEIDQLVSQHKRVNLSFTGDFEPGMEAGKITMQPEQIEVRGAKTLVESVLYVNVDVPVESVTPRGSTLFLEAVALDANGLPVPNVRLSSGVVEVGATLLRTKTVPLITELRGEIDDRFEIMSIDIPREITARGNNSDLAEIESIEANPIDVTGITATTNIPIEVTLPDGVEIANRSAGRMYVRIEIKGMTTVDFEYDSSEILMENLAEEYGAYINTPSVTLQAVGREAVLSETTREDFALSVDLTDLEPGIYTVPVTAAYDKTLNSAEVIPREVHITIHIDQREDPPPDEQTPEP